MHVWTEETREEMDPVVYGGMQGRSKQLYQCQWLLKTKESLTWFIRPQGAMSGP